MERRHATAMVVELAGDAPIISSVGNATFDLVAAAKHRPQNFYLWNSMGMAASVGLGLALARPDLRVVILDGDGALLMNLSSLATARMAGANNLVHVVWNNGGWEITGDQPMGTSYGIDLEAIARGCGFTHTATVDTIDGFKTAFRDAMRANESCFIVAKVANTSSPHDRPSKTLTLIRETFATSIAK